MGVHGALGLVEGGAPPPGLMWGDGETRAITEWYGDVLMRFR